LNISEPREEFSLFPEGYLTIEQLCIEIWPGKLESNTIFVLSDVLGSSLENVVDQNSPVYKYARTSPYLKLQLKCVTEMCSYHETWQEVTVEPPDNKQGDSSAGKRERSNSHSIHRDKAQQATALDGK
jgi:hypothetical protein